ncbi:hypothetical protein SS50377_24379 [Spironucleus salmonicida]|uniref:Uncharacterized protein n=1 Tax=Spironucleus salmonicida TaxID=348837 RepID=V6LQU0_9EUKA|nr:hypothetical protein SS50377_24379 [Spironucleus salmonicida]|eukprot:EST46071.1 Hypothetical protein SS50377_14061 [Spironucleus salmonicida]
MSLLDICKKSYQDFLSTNQLQAAVLLDGVQHFAVFQNVCYVDENSPSPVQAAVLLIALQKLYLDLKITPQDRREIYKNMNKIYRQVVEETKTEQLEAAIMVDFALSIVNAKEPENNFSHTPQLANREYQITAFYMTAKMEDFVDLNDWEDEINSFQYQKPSYIKKFEIYPIKEGNCEVLTANNYEIPEIWQKEEKNIIEAKIDLLNSQITTEYQNHPFTTSNHQLKIDPKINFFYPRKQLFDADFVAAISKQTAIQPVVKLSKLKHQKFYFLIPKNSDSNEFDERNFFYFLTKGKYVSFNSISAFGRTWSDQKKDSEEGKNIVPEVVLDAANLHVKIGSVDITFISQFEKYKQNDVVKMKGIRKYFIEEGRLIGLIQSESVLKELQQNAIYNDDVFKLAAEHKMSVFNFFRDESKQGVNYFKIYKTNEENVASVKKIWKLLMQRIQ